MQNARHIAQNAGHNVQNDSCTMLNVGCNALNVCQGPKEGGLEVPPWDPPTPIIEKPSMILDVECSS